MAFYDWNKDGKKDVQDDFIEYNIYSESMKNNNGNSNNNSGGGCLGWAAVILILLGLLSQCGG